MPRSIKAPKAPRARRSPKSVKSPTSISSRWQKGISGNPAGRPLGSRNKSTVLLESLFADESEALVRKAVELAMKGDIQAMRLCLERACPPRRDRPIEFPLPNVIGTQNGSALTGSVLEAVASGEITPSEAETLVRIIQAHLKIVEGEDLADRVLELERRFLSLSELRAAVPEDSDEEDCDVDEDAEITLGDDEESVETCTETPPVNRVDDGAAITLDGDEKSGETCTDMSRVNEGDDSGGDQ